MHDKMNDEFSSCKLEPGVFIYEIWELKDFLKTPETEKDKGKILNVIEYCRSRFKLLIEDID